MNINLDMLSRDQSKTLYATGAYHYPFLRPILEKAVARAKVKLVLGHDQPNGSSADWTRDSDHFSFHRENIPFIYFGVEDYEYHHKSNDDFENTMPAFYVGAVETIIDAIRELDRNSGNIRSFGAGR
jgi:Zn-dependent M28 family amino/carboxypeptidase